MVQPWATLQAQLSARQEKSICWLKKGRTPVEGKLLPLPCKAGGLNRAWTRGQKPCRERSLPSLNYKRWDLPEAHLLLGCRRLCRYMKLTSSLLMSLQLKEMEKKML